MSKLKKFIPCSAKLLPEKLKFKAAKTARKVNPLNAPFPVDSATLPPQAIAVLTTKYWGTGGVKLKVGFMERVSAALADKILSHMNAWGTEFGANVTFELNSNKPEVRISLRPGGYWSYLGTDVLQIPQGQQTMNLEGFSLNTPESEYRRVVRHETGHTLGFPHEHMRSGIVARLNETKTIQYFQQTQGWTPQQIRAQVLTPLSESSLMGTPVDQESIMCYQLPASITNDGRPIPGGLDINQTDAGFARKIYPKDTSPVVPPATTNKLVIEYTGQILTAKLVS